MSLSLEEQTQEFYNHIHQLFLDVFGIDEQLIMKTRGQNGSGTYVLIKQEDQPGIPLRIGSQVALFLNILYKCAQLTPDSYMRIEKSTFHVLSCKDIEATTIHGKTVKTIRTEPLFRYDYVRHPNKDDSNPKESDIPNSHIHFYGYNESAQMLLLRNMNMAGSKNRFKAERKKYVETGEFPTSNVIHFPTGGPRFRPSLEDVCEMLITEFGVDHEPDALNAIEKNREEYRLRQIKTIIREFPDLAYDALSKVDGVTVSGQRPTRRDHLATLERF